MSGVPTRKNSGGASSRESGTSGLNPDIRLGHWFGAPGFFLAGPVLEAKGGVGEPP